MRGNISFIMRHSCKCVVHLRKIEGRVKSLMNRERERERERGRETERDRERGREEERERETERERERKRERERDRETERERISYYKLDVHVNLMFILEERMKE